MVQIDKAAYAIPASFVSDDADMLDLMLFNERIVISQIVELKETRPAKWEN